MADVSVERLRELHEQATGGRWEARNNRQWGDGGDRFGVQCSFKGAESLMTGWGVCAVWTGKEDAELIAAARNALPDLLALYDAVDDWVKQRDSVHKGYDVPASIRAALARLDGASDG